MQLRSMRRKMEYDTVAEHLKTNGLHWFRTVPPQLAERSGITHEQLKSSHTDVLHMVERIDGVPLEDRQLLTARQHLSFAMAIEAGRKESSQVLSAYLLRGICIHHFHIFHVLMGLNYAYIFPEQVP